MSSNALPLPATTTSPVSGPAFFLKLGKIEWYVRRRRDKLFKVILQPNVSVGLRSECLPLALNPRP